MSWIAIIGSFPGPRRAYTQVAQSYTAEALDMLEKGQIQTRTNFSLEEKALGAIERLTEYAIRGLLILTLFIGSCLLCTASPVTMEMTNVRIDFPAIGIAGYMLSVVLAIFLYRDVKKRK